MRTYTVDTMVMDDPPTWEPIFHVRMDPKHFRTFLIQLQRECGTGSLLQYVFSCLRVRRSTGNVSPAWHFNGLNRVPL